MILFLKVIIYKGGAPVFNNFITLIIVIFKSRIHANIYDPDLIKKKNN